MAQRSIERVFLGWERPFLPLACEAWIAHVERERLDPARCVLVLAGRRAVRRLEEQLALKAPAHWSPPRIVSEGELANVVRRERATLASEWQRALAWREALAAVSLEQRAALWSGAGGSDIAGLARVCARAFDELAREGLDGAQVAAASALGARERWTAFAAVEARYVAALAERGCIDPAALARDSAQAELCEGLDVQLFGLADSPRALRQLVRRLERVTSFVFAPASEAAGFDEFGALRADAWAERGIEFPSERWLVVDGPDDQARAALEVFARLDPKPRPEQVAIGVPDEDVLPFLERRLLEAGCEPRWAGGRKLSGSRAAQLVLVALEWLAHGSPEAFSRLLAHPDFESLCGGAGGELGAALDRFVAAHVPSRIDGEWAEPARSATRAALELLESARRRALELFQPIGVGGVATSAQWADALSNWLRTAYGSADLAAREPRAWRHARSLEALANVLAEVRDADAGGAGLELDVASVRELLVARLEALEIPPPPGDGRPLVELIGWLELVVDDAPQLVITGVQEGSLPTSSNAAGLLSEALRRELGLGHEARRVARDVWALSALLASRERVTLISGRRNAARDPLRPSRFVFRCADEELVARVRKVWPEHEAQSVPPPGQPTRYRPPFEPRQAPTTLRVTDFGAYLTSPYAFYVQRVLGLTSASARVLELDPLAFGSLAHEVLEALGDSALRACTDESRLRAELTGRLDELARLRFGRAPLPAVALQVEKLRGRLERFARWQAREVAQGWRIVHLEWDAPPFELDGVTIRGRIDRIERHAASGAWRIVDYKTSDEPQDPLKVHWSAARAWKDLQLPLYRELTRPLCGEGEVELGYVALSRAPSDELYAPFSPKPEVLDTALDAAREVIACIRRGEFAEVGARRPFDPSLAALCGFDLLEGEDDEPEKEDAS